MIGIDELLPSVAAAAAAAGDTQHTCCCHRRRRCCCCCCCCRRSCLSWHFSSFYLGSISNWLPSERAWAQSMRRIKNLFLHFAESSLKHSGRICWRNYRFSMLLTDRKGHWQSEAKHAPNISDFSPRQTTRKTSFIRQLIVLFGESSLSLCLLGLLGQSSSSMVALSGLFALRKTQKAFGPSLVRSLSPRAARSRWKGPRLCPQVARRRCPQSTSSLRLASARWAVGQVGQLVGESSSLKPRLLGHCC